MTINVELLIFLCDVYKQIPSRTPDRLDMILQFARDFIDSNVLCQDSVILNMHDEKEYDYHSEFQINIETIRKLSQNLPILENSRAVISNSYRRILLPSEIFCCQKVLSIKYNQFVCFG